jgi:hypothetical protein
MTDLATVMQVHFVLKELVRKSIGETQVKFREITDGYLL